MKKWLSDLLIVALLLIGLVLLYLTNTGVISFGRSYIQQLSSELPETAEPTAIKNVNLIPMEGEQLVENQTVIVRDGLISVVGASNQVNVPEGALVVDGRGKYLMPGLVDMHVHIENENDLLLFVANGVTSVRNMWGNTGKKLLLGMPDQLVLRRKIYEGKLLGPTIYTTGPIMEGSPAFHPAAEIFDNPEAASDSVKWQAEQGYEFVKVYDHLALGAYQETLRTARENDLPVVGHVPFAVGIDGALESGQQTIEHMSGYIDPDAVEFIIPEDQLEHYAIKTKEAGVWNVPTLSVYPKTQESSEGFQRLQDQPGMRYLSPGTRLISPFLYMMAAWNHTYRGSNYRQRIEALNRQMVAALHEAGAGILLGTDAAQPYHMPGFAIHEELDFLVGAGLSPYEALQAGTRNAAEVMGKEDQFGTIEEGKRADLILLEGNPLEDVSNLQDPSGVMLQGRWIDADQLQAMLDGLADSHKPTLIERLWPLTLIGLGAIFIWRRLMTSGRVSQ